MVKMRIIIPTRGRTNNQHTLASLPRELKEYTTLVCPKKDTLAFENFYPPLDVEIVEQPDPNWKIGTKRKWIIEEWARRGYDKIFMLDDDLSFATRITETDWRLREIKGTELIPEFERIEAKLGEEFPHVGFGIRQGNNRLETVGWKTPARMLYSLGYYLPVVLKHVVLGRIEIREDMDITLQLLRKGYANAVWQTTTCDQRSFSPGGCSVWRTVEMSNESCQQLAEFHPGYVSITKKEYVQGVNRQEVIIQWVKAYEDGKSSLKQTSFNF